jgi:4-amino-4-deoxy-L-arabinose transferase-like glycosyltransferase
MLYTGYLLRWDKGQPFVVPSTAVGWLVLGALTLGAALWLRQPRIEVFTPEKDVSRGYSINWKWLALGAAALYLLAEANAYLLLRSLRLSQHLQAFLFTVGLIAILRGAGGLRFTQVKSLYRHSTIPLLIITVLGLALRVWMISDTVRLMIDELHFFDAVNFLRQVNTAPILHPMNSIASFPYTFAYLQTWTVAFFGTNFTGMRMASAIVGSLTIPAIYLLGRALFDRKTALIAATLLAVFPPHIHFSRLALNNIADPLFGTLALAFLVRGLKRNSQTDYVLAGINLGLSSYFYEGGRLLFLGVFVIWLGIFLVAYRPRKHARAMVLMALAALLVMMPYYSTLARPEYSFTARFANEAIRPRYLLQDLQTKPLMDVLLAHYDHALKYSFFHTIYSPDSSQFYYGGYTAILPWYVVPFYALGLFYLLWKARVVAMLLWLWIGLAIIGISFVVNTDWTVRFVVIFPAMMLAVAVGLRYPLEFLWPVRFSRRYLYAFIAIIVAVIGILQLTHYFGEHLTLYNSQIRLGRSDSYDVFDRAAQYSQADELYYLSDQIIFTPVFDAVRTLTQSGPNYRIWRLDKITRDSLESLPRHRMLLFAVAPTDEGVISLLHDVFVLKGPVWSPYDSVPIDHQYALYIYSPS